MKLAIMQPYLFPYLGYFAMAGAVDRFVFLDDAQFIKQGWINRNRWAVADQPAFFTFPVTGVGATTPIDAVKLHPGERWRRKLMDTLTQSYGRLPNFPATSVLFADTLSARHMSIAETAKRPLPLTALQSLRITGEVITTPYSFVATSHSLLWNGIKPVFVDIDPNTLNLDPSKIEAAITPQTTAIMPVHCYGHPCDVEAIQQIADNYNLKIIYDAAHAFGVQDTQDSILRHGDLSVLSFHATKVFNTFEGGAIVCHDAKTKQRIDHLKNFGFVDEVTVVAPGINGKMSEINAALGLLQLKSIDEALQKRKAVDNAYWKALAGIKGIHCLSAADEKTANYAYFPILVQPDYPLSRDALYQKLHDNGIYARRYFYPLISDFPMYRGMPSAAHANLPVARKVSEQVICLPIYPALSSGQVDSIVELIA